MARTREPARRALGIALASGLFLTALGGSAHAQSEGFKLGSGRLHPTFETETHEVVNPGYVTSGRVVNDAYLVGRPRARYELEGDRLELAASGDLEYRRYLGLESPDTASLSTFAGHLGLTVAVDRDATVSWRVHERLGRQADSANETNGYRLLHVNDDVGLGVDVRPGRGALLVTGEYALWYDRYDRGQPALVTPSALDNLVQRPTLRATWKFLPRTALLLEAAGLLTTYTGGPFHDPDTGATYANPSTSILLTYLGAVGAVTPRVTALAKIGYGDNFLSSDRMRTVVGQAEIAYAVTETSRLRAGFARAIAPTSFFAYYVVDRPYVAAQQLFFAETRLDARFEYSSLRYGRPLVGDQTARADRTLVGDFTLERRFRSWLALAIVDRLEVRTSSYRAPDGQRIGYTVNDVFLRVGVDVDSVAAVIAR